MFSFKKIHRYCALPPSLQGDKFSFISVSVQDVPQSIFLPFLYPVQSEFSNPRWNQSASLRVIRVLTVLFCIPRLKHFFCPFYLFVTDGFLIQGILGGIGYDQALVQFFCGIRLVLIIKSFVIFRQFREIDRLVIADPLESLRT